MESWNFTRANQAVGAVARRLWPEAFEDGHLARPVSETAAPDAKSEAGGPMNDAVKDARALHPVHVSADELSNEHEANQLDKSAPPHGGYILSAGEKVGVSRGDGVTPCTARGRAARLMET